MGGHHVRVTVNKILARAAKISARVDDEEIPEFEVSYFDEPFTDNFTLSDGHRFAVTLKKADMDRREATLLVFEFPEHFVPPGYRASPDEVFKLIAHYQ